MKESGENYVEAILILKRELGAVRSVDVSRYLGYARASVSRAVHLLKEQGLITTDGKGFIELTGKGRAVAEGIYERHSLLVRLLGRMGVCERTAEQDACRIEHAISDETFERLKKYMEEG